MKAFSSSPSSMLAMTRRTGWPDAASASTPAGAATTHTAVTSVAPRATSKSMVCTIEPPVASIGSSTNTGIPDRSAGRDSRYGTG